MSDQQRSRDLDLVVYGATGFVGVLVARHLAEHAPAGTRIALAGRSATKLAAVQARARGRLAGRSSRTPPTTAALAGWPPPTRVVITTVGPYAKYGRALAHACAAAGTDYVDLTGEVVFVRASIDENHELARSTGARIVHSCGFDSIPSDIGVHVLCTAGPGRRRGRPDRHHAGGHQHARRDQRRHDRLDAPPARRGQDRTAPAPDRRQPVLAEPRPSRRAGPGPAGGHGHAARPGGRSVAARQPGARS